MRCQHSAFEPGKLSCSGKRRLIGYLRPAFVLTLHVLCASRGFADARPSDPAARLLAAAKEASGGSHWEAIVTWHESGQITKAALEGTFERWVNVVGLRNAVAFTFTFGPSSRSEGWNGSLPWSTDERGVTRRANGAQALTDAYRHAFAYWSPDRFPSERTYVGTRRLGDQACDVVKLTPEGGEPFELWLDRDTHLIRREVDLAGSRPRTRDFSDFRERFGVKVPVTVREGAGDPKEEQITMTTTAVEANVFFPADRFDPPVYLPLAGVFPPGTVSLTIPFKLLNNHIYLPVKLNGGEPQPFIFDTGAFNVLSKQEAQTEGIRSEGAFPGGGIGRNTVKFGYANVDALEVGGITLKHQLFATFDLSIGIRFEDLPTLGVVGYEIAKQAVVVLDYDKQEITFVKPAAFRPPQGAASLPLKFREHIPVVEAVLDGVAGDFQLDTGARDSLILTRSFADAHALIEKYHARREVVGGYGLGGPLRGLLARPGEFRLGGFRVQAPVALISSSWRRAAAMAGLAGNLGEGILKRFTLTLDYVHRVLYLQPNAHFEQPDAFDRSGLWVMRAPEGCAFEIADVIPDSPASIAGLKVGEKILKVDEVDASALTVGALRERLEQGPGTKVALEVQGEEGIRVVALALEDLF